MIVAGLIVAALAAFLIFRFVAGLVKFGLLAVIIIVVLWFVTGGAH